MLKVHKCPVCDTVLDDCVPSLNLTASQVEILRIITKARGRFVLTQDIIFQLYQQRDEPETAENVLRRQIYAIRKELGNIIEVRRGRIGGYRLMEASQKRYEKYFKDIKLESRHVA